MELPGDVLRLAQWLAEVTGNSDVLLAVFHKPSSPRIVIIEVDRSFTDVRRLLGQHFWAGEKGFLINPPPDIASFNYSGIFYCHYTTGRMVQKHGWKRIDFRNKMFGKPEQRKTLFKDPYPTSHYMSVPSFEPTAIDLCRNLPAALFQEGDAPKPAAKAPPPGSSAWATDRELQATNKRSKKEDSHTEEASTVTETSDDTDPEKTNLWSPLASDFAQSSMNGYNEEDVCPFHGLKCKKMCEWRVKNQKAKGPKVGGPSNTKNYQKPNRGANKNAPSINTKMANGARPSNNINAQSPISPTSPPPKRAGPSASNVKPSVRAPPPPMFISPVSATSPKSEINDPSAPMPSKIEQVA
ncbi:hypothetical protein CPB86DRAFT_780008, partial [Serendipita vermifera]